MAHVPRVALAVLVGHIFIINYYVTNCAHISMPSSEDKTVCKVGLLGH